MRILQMLPALNSGGVETGTIDMALALKKAGHEPYVMSSGGGLVKELVKAGIPHITLPVHRKSIISIFLIGTVRKFIEKEKIDVVHARSRVPGWIGYFAVRKTRAVFITTCHGHYSQHFFSRIMGWGKEVIVVSKMIGRYMIDGFKVLPERINLIYRGVNLDRYPFFPDKYIMPKKSRKFIVVNVGRLTPIKGHEHFIKAIHLAWREIPHIEAWIVGAAEKGKEEYAEELKALVKRLGLEEKVKFLGHRNDIPLILREADVLALTSNVPEAFGRVLIEAGACGTVAIATQIGGMTEVIDHDDTGMLVPVSDEEILSRTLLELYQNPQKMQRLADRMREKVERDFSLTAMVQKTLAVYEKALTRKNILILKLGALGDLMLIIPSLRMLRRKYPNSRITLVVDPRWYDIARSCVYIDDIIAYERNDKKKWRKLFRLAKRIRKQGYDLSIDFQNNRQTHLLPFLAGIPVRYGFRRKWSGWLLTNGARFEWKDESPVEHQFRILQMLGIVELDQEMELFVPDKDRDKAELFLRNTWINQKQALVGFSVSASSAWPTKNWPVEYFVELAKIMESRMNARIFLFGDRTAIPLACAFPKETFPSVVNLIGRTSVGELMAMISKMDLLITGDSAPMHIAAASKVPFVALFGPTDPKRHLPPGRGHIVLKKDLPCSPCYSGHCKAKEFACMPGISVEEVFLRAKRILESRKEAAAEL